MANRSIVIEMRVDGHGKKLGSQVTGASRRIPYTPKPGFIGLWHVLVDDTAMAAIRDEINASVELNSLGEGE